MRKASLEHSYLRRVAQRVMRRAQVQRGLQLAVQVACCHCDAVAALEEVHRLLVVVLLLRVRRQVEVRGVHLYVLRCTQEARSVEPLTSRATLAPPPPPSSRGTRQEAPGWGCATHPSLEYV